MAAPRVGAAVTRPLHNFTILNATSAQVDAKLQGMKAMGGPRMTRNACPNPPVAAITRRHRLNSRFCDGFLDNRRMLVCPQNT